MSNEPHVEFVIPYAGEEDPTAKRGVLTLRGRVDSKLDEAAPSTQERALRLLEHFLSVGTEEQHAIEWTARLLARRRR